MNRRKGETTARRNEREFPHLVELAVPTGDFQDQHLEFDTFHREQGIPIRGGSGHREEGNATSASVFRMPISLMRSARASVANM